MLGQLKVLWRKMGWRWKRCGSYVVVFPCVHQTDADALPLLQLSPPPFTASLLPSPSAVSPHCSDISLPPSGILLLLSPPPSAVSTPPFDVLPPPFHAPFVALTLPSDALHPPSDVLPLTLWPPSGAAFSPSPLMLAAYLHEQQLAAAPSQSAAVPNSKPPLLP